MENDTLDSPLVIENKSPLQLSFFSLRFSYKNEFFFSFFKQTNQKEKKNENKIQFDKETCSVESRHESGQTSFTRLRWVDQTDIDWIIRWDFFELNLSRCVHPFVDEVTRISVVYLFLAIFFPFPFCCRVIIGRRHHTNPKHSTTPSTHRWRANSRPRTIQTRFHRCWIIKHDGRTSWRWHRDGPISMNWRLLTDSCQGGLFYLDSIRVHFDVS